MKLGEEVAVDGAGDVYVTAGAVSRFVAGDLSSPEWVIRTTRNSKGSAVNPANSEEVFYYTGSDSEIP